MLIIRKHVFDSYNGVVYCCWLNPWLNPNHPRLNSVRTLQLILKNMEGLQWQDHIKIQNVLWNAQTVAKRFRTVNHDFITVSLTSITLLISWMAIIALKTFFKFGSPWRPPSGQNSIRALIRGILLSKNSKVFFPSFYFIVFFQHHMHYIFNFLCPLSSFHPLNTVV